MTSSSAATNGSHSRSSKKAQSSHKASKTTSQPSKTDSKNKSSSQGGPSESQKYSKPKQKPKIHQEPIPIRNFVNEEPDHKSLSVKEYARYDDCRRDRHHEELKRMVQQHQ